MSYHIYNNEEVCANCAHFYPHYGQHVYGHMQTINCGHCPYPRMKHRKPSDTCGNWERRG